MDPCACVRGGLGGAARVCRGAHLAERGRETAAASQSGNHAPRQGPARSIRLSPAPLIPPVVNGGEVMLVPANVMNLWLNKFQVGATQICSCAGITLPVLRRLPSA